MTLVVVWWERGMQIVADARISNGERPITDSGPKILPVPIRASSLDGGDRARVTYEATAAFAYAGSTLCAMSTHALASACAWALISNREQLAPPLGAVGEIFRRVGQHYLEDIGGRGADPRFEAFLIGWCPVAQRHQIIKIWPVLQDGRYQMQLAVTEPISGEAYAIGSGGRAFVQVSEELGPCNQLVAFHELLSRELRPDIGGASQRATVYERVLTLVPVLGPGEHPGQGEVTFLGYPLRALDIGDYTVGYVAEHPPIPGSNMPPGVYSRVV